MGHTTRLLLCIPFALLAACATGEDLLGEQPRRARSTQPLDGGEDSGFGGMVGTGGSGGGSGGIPVPGVGGFPMGGSAGAGTGGFGEGGSGQGGLGQGGSGQGGLGGGGWEEDAGGGPADDGCDPGMKRCGGICVGPSFGVGCDLESCEPCPDPPANSQGFCGGDGCDFMCHGGYVLNDAEDGCEPEAVGGTGGAGGTGGSGGSGGTPSTGGSSGGGGCSPDSCPSCGIPPKCCNALGNCGCFYGVCV